MKNRKPWSFCETPEEKCTMSYCYENGCQNRKRNYVEGNDLIADVVRSYSMKKEKWTSEILECDDCCYAYRSIHPKGLYKLECPNCGNISKHNKVFDTQVKQSLLHPQKLIPLPDAVHILRMHNRWRRGLEEIEMIDPQLLGECLDRVIEYFDQLMLLDKNRKV